MEKHQEFLLKNSCWKELKENLNSVVIDYHSLLCYEEASVASSEQQQQQLQNV